jgi:hypothetical protein
MIVRMQRSLFLLLASLLLSISAKAQQTITFNTKAFGACETIEASLGNSGEGFAIFIAEHELRAGYGGKYEKKYGMTPEDDNLNNIPTGYTLILDVDFTRKFKFPIEEKDSVYIDLSKMQLDKRSQKFMKAQMAAQKNKTSARNQEISSMKARSKSLEAKAKEIAQQMKEGKISQQEASQKLMALQDQITNMVDNSSVLNVEIQEPEVGQNYAINFVDTKELVEENVFSGVLHIIRFNEKEFVARLSNGKQLVECLEKRAASSVDTEKKCKETESSLFPGMYILKESSATMYINAKLKKFQDFR